MWWQKNERGGVWLSEALLVGGAVVSLLSFGCEEKKETPVQTPIVAPVQLPELAKPRVAPAFTIDESSPMVGFSRSMLTTTEGQSNVVGLEQLRADLAGERQFIEGQEVKLEVHRKASPSWVSVYLKELEALGPARVVILTDTRPDFPSTIQFDSGTKGKAPDCSLVAIVTEERGTAVWRVSGGVAQKRGRGLSGPDLSRTADTLGTMAKTCASDRFVVQGAKGVEWGMIFDLAASGVALEQKKLKVAILPETVPTPGRPL